MNNIFLIETFSVVSKRVLSMITAATLHGTMIGNMTGTSDPTAPPSNVAHVSEKAIAGIGTGLLFEVFNKIYVAPPNPKPAPATQPAVSLSTRFNPCRTLKTKCWKLVM